MAFILLLALALPPRPTPATDEETDTELAGKIETWFRAIFAADDDSKEVAEAKKVYEERGLATVGQVGELPAYEFVVLLVSEKLPMEFRAQVLSKVKEAAARKEIPSDAATFYAAKLRIEKAKDKAEAHPPSNPALRDEIERMFKVDQAVREQPGFDPKKLQQTDQQHAAPLQAILNKYGVPTYEMAGPEAAGEFVIMIQHQAARFRQQVLPKLKANVDAGQADPESYALVYDRSQRDMGKKQLYGEQLECNAGEKLHEAPLEDETHVNQRRAELGLLRMEFYTQIASETMPQFCPPAGTKK
jgi:hypothetical protein